MGVYIWHRCKRFPGGLNICNRSIVPLLAHNVSTRLERNEEHRSVPRRKNNRECEQRRRRENRISIARKPPGEVHKVREKDAEGNPDVGRGRSCPSHGKDPDPSPATEKVLAYN